jgi:hypothetical protein
MYRSLFLFLQTLVNNSHYFSLLLYITLHNSGGGSVSKPDRLPFVGKRQSKSRMRHNEIKNVKIGTKNCTSTCSAQVKNGNGDVSKRREIIKGMKNNQIINLSINHSYYLYLTNIFQFNYVSVLNTFSFAVVLTVAITPKG